MDKTAVIGKLDHVCAVAGRLRDALHTSKAATDIDWAGLYRELQGFEGFPIIPIAGICTRMSFGA